LAKPDALDTKKNHGFLFACNCCGCNYKGNGGSVRVFFGASEADDKSVIHGLILVSNKIERMLLGNEPIARHFAPSGDIFGCAWVECCNLKKLARKHGTKFPTE
jgi:hypothetical protein